MGPEIHERRSTPWAQTTRLFATYKLDLFDVQLLAKAFVELEPISNPRSGGKGDRWVTVIVIERDKEHTVVHNHQKK